MASFNHQIANILLHHPEKKIAHHRLTLLQVAERIRNVSEACRRHGVSRSQFYEYKRAFQERGLEGLMDRPPIPKSFPNETPPEIREKILALSLLHPAWGPMRLSDQLRLEGITVSPSTVRNLWLKEGMETCQQATKIDPFPALKNVPLVFMTVRFPVPGSTPP